MKEHKRNRKLSFDYSTEGVYLLTSCIQDRAWHFAKIIEGRMQFSEYGKIADKQIHWLQRQYSYFRIHNYVIMPNHVHILGEIYTDEIPVFIRNRKICRNNPNHNNSYIEDGRDHPLYMNRPLHMDYRDNPIKIKSISELMGAYKTTISKKIHLAGNTDFKWQRSFHDHIVRDDKSLYRISTYIDNNPKNWGEDIFKMRE